MGSERPVVINPKDNNRFLLITTEGQSGKTIRLALLKPGQSFRPEKPCFQVKEVPKHKILDATLQPDGSYSTAPAKPDA